MSKLAYVSLGEPHSGRPPTLLVMVTNAGGKEHTEELTIEAARDLLTELESVFAIVDR